MKKEYHGFHYEKVEICNENITVTSGKSCLEYDYMGFAPSTGPGETCQILFSDGKDTIMPRAYLKDLLA